MTRYLNDAAINLNWTASINIFTGAFISALCIKGVYAVIIKIFKKMHSWDAAFMTLVVWGITAFCIGNAMFFINLVRPGFYFEKYDTKNAYRELEKMHPLGSDVNALVNTLKKAGAKIKYGENITTMSAVKNVLPEKLIELRMIVPVNKDLVKIKFNILADYEHPMFRLYSWWREWQVIITSRDGKLIYFRIDDRDNVL